MLSNLLGAKLFRPKMGIAAEFGMEIGFFGGMIQGMRYGWTVGQWAGTAVTGEGIGATIGGIEGASVGGIGGAMAGTVAGAVVGGGLDFAAEYPFIM